MHYVVYYPDEGRYSRPLTIKEVKALVNQFEWAYIVNLDTAEVID